MSSSIKSLTQSAVYSKEITVIKLKDILNEESNADTIASDIHSKLKRILPKIGDVTKATPGEPDYGPFDKGPTVPSIDTRFYVKNPIVVVDAFKKMGYKIKELSIESKHDITAWAISPDGKVSAFIESWESFEDRVTRISIHTK